MAQAQILYVGTEDGLAIFSNPGRLQRWLAVGRELRGERIVGLVSQPAQPLEVAAATPAALWFSKDGGQSWQPGAPATTPAVTREVELSGQPPTMLRAAQQQIERSEDYGQSWQPTDPPVTGAITVLLSATYHPDTVFAGSQTGEVLISSDRGRTWNLLAQQLPGVTALAAARAL